MMDQDDSEFLARLLETFRVEAEEHFEVLSNGLLELERDPDGEHLPLVETLFREAHSLKGAARAVELGDIESVCQAMESVFAAWKRGEIGASAELFDALNEAVDALRESSAHGRDSASAAETMGGLMGRLAKLAEADKPAAEAHGRRGAAGCRRARGRAAVRAGRGAVADRSASSAAAADGRRAQTRGCGVRARRRPARQRLLGRAGDAGSRPHRGLPPGRHHQGVALAPDRTHAAHGGAHHGQAGPAAAGHRAERAAGRIRRLEEEMAVGAQPPSPRSAGVPGPMCGSWSRRPTDEVVEARRRSDDKLLEYLDWNKTFVSDIAARIARLTTGSEHDQRSLGPLVEDLLDDVKTLVMLPFSSLSQVFPKMVRDLARAEGKAVDLTVTGGDIEIDRHVLETIKDPIIHILRNCVGHGVETPDVRAKRGKPVRGEVTIAVTRVEGNKLSIVVADDGGGIDISGVRQIAGKVGARSQDHIDSLDDEQAMTLVFESGVSTNPIVTDVSGRGIGLAIVQEKVEQLGGTATVRSEPGEGTWFELVVPATLASSRGVLVRVADRLFVLPTLHVDRVTRIDPRDIATVENSDTVTMDGQAVAFAFLHDVLDLPRKPRSDDVAMLPVVVLMSGNERVAFAVDWVLGDQEVLVKSLGPQLENLRYVTGATVLESDKIALILHPPEVIRAAAHGTAQSTPVAVLFEEAAARRKKRILVAEDSITSRTLLKNILETTGYEVRTVVDGLEALTALMEEEFDLLISDVEMPRMNGFDLTARIRSEDKHADLPVMLVTSLESREDREKGVDVGANAYITKGSFDQTTLLETARRLV